MFAKKSFHILMIHIYSLIIDIHVLTVVVCCNVETYMLAARHSRW